MDRRREHSLTMLDKGRLPTGLMVDAVLKQCDLDCIGHYILQRGNYASGLILVKLDFMNGTASVQTQQRDFMSDKLVWQAVFGDESVEEKKADDYIVRQKSIDPDLWIIAFEVQKDAQNPFYESC